MMPESITAKDHSIITECLENGGSLIAAKFQTYAHLRNDKEKLVGVVQKSTLGKLEREKILIKSKVQSTKTPCWVLP